MINTSLVALIFFGYFKVC